MTTHEHLAAIVRHIDNLLAIAEKRTPGEWQHFTDMGQIGDVSTCDHDPICITQERVEFAQMADLKGCWREHATTARNNNAAFIAACAGNAEAGWRATKHAAEWLGFMIETGEEFRVRGLVDDMLAAWPVELLKKDEG